MPQIRDIFGKAQLSTTQLHAKQIALQNANSYQYSEADVARKIQEEQKQASAAGKAPVLTTRQKLMAQQGFTGETKQPNTLAARPLKMERNVLGQVIRSQRE